MSPAESATLPTMQPNKISAKLASTAVSADSSTVAPHTPLNTSPTQSNSKHRFSESDLIKYKDYSTTISNLEDQNLESLAESQPLRIEVAAVQRDAAYEKWRTAESSKAQAKQALENLDKWNIGKLLPTGKRGAARREAKRIEHQQELDYTIAAVNRAFMELETAKTRLDEAESERDSLRSRLSDLFLARCNQNALVERMFSHSSWSSDPMLGPLRQEIQKLEQQAAEALTDDGPYCKTYKILTASQQKIHTAMQDFRATGAMELFQVPGEASRAKNVIANRRGSVPLEPKHRASIQQANELLQLVAEEVIDAKRLLPVLPFHDDSLIESARKGIFEPILSPDFVRSAETQGKLKLCIDTLVQLKKEILNCLQYAQRNLTRDSYSPLLKQLRLEITAKKEEMAEYQHSLLKTALQDL